MAKPIPSHAEPKMIAWARKHSHLTIADAAARTKFPVETLKAWESGEAMPSLVQLRKLSKVYQYSLSVFYLEGPGDVNIKRQKQKYRLLPARGPRRESPELMFAIRWARDRQDWASGFLREEDDAPLPFVGSRLPTDRVADVAADLTRLLRLEVAAREPWRNPDAAYGEVRARCEDAGVFVFHLRRVEVGEMRGFALTDDVAPVIGINSADAATARTFSLVHEMTHLLLGESSLDGGDADEPFPTEETPTERFCNAVATEVLVPEDDFRANVPKGWEGFSDAIVNNLASRYKVSRLVIARRLVETGFADDRWYARVRPLYSVRSKAARRSGGPPPYRKALSRNGRNLVRLSLAAFRGGDITGGQLTSIIGLGLSHVPKLEAALYPSRKTPAFEE